MISRKRLEEFAKKCIPVYAVTKGDVLKIETRDPETGLMGNFVNWVVELNGISRRLNAHLNDIYETKEDAEFALEFQNIKRTETLNLPTWKKFKKDESFQFSDKYGSDWDLYIYSSGIIVLLNGNKTYYFNNSKEGYIEACKIVKKLFLGERC